MKKLRGDVLALACIVAGGGVGVAGTVVTLAAMDSGRGNVGVENETCTPALAPRVTVQTRRHGKAPIVTTEIRKADLSCTEVLAISGLRAGEQAVERTARVEELARVRVELAATRLEAATRRLEAQRQRLEGDTERLEVELEVMESELEKILVEGVRGGGR